jgi:hypothetical protein
VVGAGGGAAAASPIAQSTKDRTHDRAPMSARGYASNPAAVKPSPPYGRAECLP